MRQRALFISACAGMLVFGIVLAILGTLFGMPEMRERLHIDLAEQGNMFLFLYLGIFLASMIAGPMIDHLGNKLTLLGSSLLVAAAMVLFAMSSSLSTASVAAVVLGFGGGGLNTSTNVLVSDLYGDKRGPMLNLLGIFFGVGALCIPLLAASIQGHFTIPQLLFFCAAISGACAVAYAVMKFPPALSPQGFSLRATLSVARYPGVLLLAFLLFFESGNEACIGGWTSTYANANGFEPRIATLVLAGYWAALMFSRIIAATVLANVPKARVVLGSAVLSLLGCAILLSAQSLPLLVLGVVIIGVSYAPIFPTALAIAGDRYSNTGTVFGLLFAIALIGGMAFPWGVGQVSQQFGIRIGMVVPLAGAIGISILAAVLMVQERTARVRNAQKAAM
ncbi:MAG TPA: MFS transporter [Terriglobales bacterium]|nr:MFS transporter [Terriglobales bacterium]